MGRRGSEVDSPPRDGFSRENIGGSDTLKHYPLMSEMCDDKLSENGVN